MGVIVSTSLSLAYGERSTTSDGELSPPNGTAATTAKTKRNSTTIGKRHGFWSQAIRIEAGAEYILDWLAMSSARNPNGFSNSDDEARLGRLKRGRVN